jgi:DNA-binding beta-propeller fold protein YncE
MSRSAHATFALAAAAGLVLAPMLAGPLARAQSDPQALPNLGRQITPRAPKGSRFQGLNPGLPERPNWLAGQAVTTVVSPDRQTLLVLTSGYNRVFLGDGPYANQPDPHASSEYVFVYDIATATPVQTQAVRIANTYNGIAFDPSGTAFYVSGGVDDNVHIVSRSPSGTWAETPEQPPLALGHGNMGLGLGLVVGPAGPVNTQVAVAPCAAGLALSSDGKLLVVANYYNDSITVFSRSFGNWTRTADLDLRPGKSNPAASGTPGGEYPFWVAVKGSGAAATAYVSSLRDREIVVVDLAGVPAVTGRIRTKGQPNKMTLDAAQALLYVAEDHTDTVDVIDTRTNAIVETIPLVAPASVMPRWLSGFRGSNPNSVALSPDQTQLYVTNGNLNCITVVALGGRGGRSQVVGLIPTGWYPNSVSFSRDGNHVYSVNSKSPTGPNPDFCYASGPPGHRSCMGANEYNPQLVKAGLQSFPRPTTAQLATLSAQVARNNRFSSAVNVNDDIVMDRVRAGVRHVILIVRENRTYDQVLGDLEVGNGDPYLTEFGRALTPNTHSLARQFVTLDNFYASAETSNDGWPWTTAAHASDVIERQYPLAYAGRGLSLDSEGLSRNVNVALPNAAYPGPGARQLANPVTPTDPDLLPGNADVAAPDGPDNELNTGYLWDAALRARLSVRNYGFFVDVTRYSLPPGEGHIPLERMPALTSPPTIVAYPTSVSLALHTDPYFRGFDNAFPDYYRFKEWEREFDANYAGAGGADLPALSLVRLMHDHTGNFDLDPAKNPAIDGVNTPETQQADNDYAVGLLVEKIARSRHADDTLVFVVEDDAQDGADHVDSHRTVALVAGAWVKQGAVVSTEYNTVDFVRTIEMVLGLPPMNINDALGRPMADVFDTRPSPWTFTATPAPILHTTGLPVPAASARLGVPAPTHGAAYWARATEGMDFTSEDRFDFAAYNRVLWQGLMGDRPYPAGPTGEDLRQGRATLLARYRAALEQAGAAGPGSN